jgi:hypothetical protein
MTGIVPHAVRWREEEAQRYFDEGGGVFTATSWRLKCRSTAGILRINLCCLHPFALRSIRGLDYAQEAQADFGQISNEEKPDLARSLHDILAGYIQNYRILTINYVITLRLATRLMNRNCMVSPDLAAPDDSIRF